VSRDPWDTRVASLHQFGKQLLDLNDLDPVYVVANLLLLEEDTLHRFLLAYSMFYHVGFAAQAAEHSGEDFWEFVSYRLDSHPRGRERRHFRGGAARTSIRYLSQSYPTPEEAVWYWIGDRKPRTFQGISNRVQEAPSYGPWIAWKLVDMIDRCCGIPVELEGTEINMFRSPRDGAGYLATGDLEPSASYTEALVHVQNAVSVLVSGFQHRSAPPLYDRPYGVLEAETVLCKWFSSVKGHYQLGEDVEFVTSSLETHPSALGDTMAGGLLLC